MSMTGLLTANNLSERATTPENGLAGLTHWRSDLSAGVIVALVSMPLSLAVSVASGAPPAAGLITAIIAGFVFPLFSGSFMTIASPAAGMAPVLYQAIFTLGRGDLQAGYALVLPLVFLAGVIQLFLSRFRINRICDCLPQAVIQGMLASIGLIVLVKQLPLLLGARFTQHTLIGMVAELPTRLFEADPSVFGLGLGTLAMIPVFGWLSRRWAPLTMMPPFFYALVAGALASLALPLAPEFLLRLPQNPLDSLVAPDVRTLATTPALWSAAAFTLASLLVVNTVESLATIRAVDGMDPYRRQSDPRRTVRGIGVSNMASSLLGGVTVIPEVMRSTVNTLAGGRTQWANVWNAVTLLVGWLTLQPVLTHIPLTVFAAVLVACGYNLCKPAYWAGAWQAGRATFAVFLTTMALTVWGDLLWGLIGGTLLSMGLNRVRKATAN